MRHEESAGVTQGLLDSYLLSQTSNERSADGMRNKLADLGVSFTFSVCDYEKSEHGDFHIFVDFTRKSLLFCVVFVFLKIFLQFISLFERFA